MTIEPISIKDIKGFLNVSLRGSVAEIAASLTDDRQRNFFILELLRTGNPDVECIFDGISLVIGLSVERGKYFPDW